MTALLIGGVDARTYGFHLISPDGWRDLAPARLQTAVIPGRDGLTLLTDRIDVGARRLTLRGLVKGATNAEARANMDLLSVALRGMAGVTIGFGDDTTRELVAVLEQVNVAPGSASLISTKFAVDISLLCLSPFARSVTPTDVTIPAFSGTTPVALPLGTAPVRPVITLTGSGGESTTDPVLTLKDAGGATVGTLELTVAMGFGEIYTIDCDAATIFNELGVNKLEFLTGGDFFSLDIAELGDYATSAWPTLEIAESAGPSRTVDITYQRAWLC